MSIIKYLESNTWSYTFICLDILLVVFGMAFQLIFRIKEKLILVIPSILILLLCIIGTFVLNSNSLTLTRWPYIIGYVAFGMTFFEIGAFIIVLINRRKQRRK